MKENCFKGGFYAKAFTLIELLVVVLIIGILASVAVPQYKRAVEKSHIVEAIANLKAIAEAHRVYYLANGKYLKQSEINKLDIDIPGTIFTRSNVKQRIMTQDWLYSPTGSGEAQRLAFAHRSPHGTWEPESHYYMYINIGEPDRVRCHAYEMAPALEKKLCAEIEANGTL